MWWQKILSWIKRFLGLREEPAGPLILEEYSSNLCRLFRISRDIEEAVRTWRSLPYYTGRYDVLIMCDRLTRKSIREGAGSKQIFKGSPLATHRVTVLQINRIPNQDKSYRVRCRFMADLDMQGLNISSGDRFAAAITDKVARKLLITHDTEIDWQDTFVSQTRRYIGSRHDP